MTRDAHSEGVTRWFVVVVVVATVIAGFSIYEAAQAHSAATSAKNTAKQNSVLIRRIRRQQVTLGELRRTQRDSCDNYETLRGAVNEFHGTMEKVLSSALARSASQASDPNASPAVRRASRAAVETYRVLLRNTHTVSASCAQKKPGHG